MSFLESKEGKIRKCFTLIELLVVISLIALLIALLLPALGEAKRRVLVTQCMSNLKQIGIGSTTYVADWGTYPTPSCINGNWVTSIHTPVYNRQNLVDIVGGAPGFWFCPLYQFKTPEDYGIPAWENKYGPHFAHANQEDVPGSTGYLLPFIIIDQKVHRYGLPWDWSESGNPDGPWDPGNPSAPAVIDNNGPDASSHNAFGPFRESNSLWGDGHAETRSKPENRIIRLSPLSIYIY